MKVQATYKGKTVEIDIPDEKLEELVKEQKKTGWEKPMLSQFYWFFDSDLMKLAYTMCVPDENRYQKGNCFTSKELAENIARYQSLDLRIRRRIAEICEPLDKRNAHKHYVIHYNRANHELEAEPWATSMFMGWSCDTLAHAKQIIKEFKDDLLWYFTEFKDRMDG